MTLNYVGSTVDFHSMPPYKCRFENACSKYESSCFKMSYALIWNAFNKKPTKKSTVIKISSNLVQENQHNHPFITLWSNCEITFGMKVGSGHTLYRSDWKCKHYLGAYFGRFYLRKERTLLVLDMEQGKCSQKAINQAEQSIANFIFPKHTFIPGLFALKFSTHYHSH